MFVYVPAISEVMEKKDIPPERKKEGQLRLICWIPGSWGESNKLNNPKVLLCNCFHLQFIFVCSVWDRASHRCCWLQKTRLISFQGMSLHFVELKSFQPASMIDRQSKQAYPASISKNIHLNEEKGSFYFCQKIATASGSYWPGEIPSLQGLSKLLNSKKEKKRKKRSFSTGG